MAKSIVVNRVNQKNYTVTLPCDAGEAASFASAILEGEYSVYEYDTQAGTETETSYKQMQIMLKNATSGVKTYVNLAVKANKSEEDVFTALIGKTINNVVVDEAFIISNRLVTL